MKTALAIWAALLVLGGLSPAFAAEDGAEQIIPLGTFMFVYTDPRQVVEMYALSSGATLIKSSHLDKATGRVSIQPKTALKKSEALKLMEKALLEQAGVVITKLDGNRVSVTYNEALPLTNVIPLEPDGKPMEDPFPPQPAKKPGQK